jgi:exopolysaccharide production protein ExoZ
MLTISSSAQASAAHPVFAAGAGGDRRFTNLEIVRIVAASLVIFFHLQGRFTLELGLLKGLDSAVMSLGSIGVDLFFVISGFVMALSVYREDTARQFTSARLKRILPSYWLLTSLAAVFMIVLPGQFAQAFSPGRFLSSLIFADGDFGYDAPLISMGWTLDLEIRFYLIVAVCLLVLPKLMPRSLVLIAVLAALVLYVEFAHQDHLMYEFGFGFAAFALTRVMHAGRLAGWTFFSLGMFGVAAWLFGLTGAQDRWLAFGVPAFLIITGVLLLPQARSPFLKRLGFASYGT